jgi:hypothetical protein
MPLDTLPLALRHASLSQPAPLSPACSSLFQPVQTRRARCALRRAGAEDGGAPPLPAGFPQARFRHTALRIPEGGGISPLVAFAAVHPWTTDPDAPGRSLGRGTLKRYQLAPA